MSKKFTSFLGTGWSFPPDFDDKHGNVSLSSDEKDIQESLSILLSTRPGERVMNPDYGCNLDDLLFAPLTLTLKTYVADIIKTAILYYEPRIDVENIDIYETDEIQGKLIISLDYFIRSTNTRRNLVYPFYTKEATDI